jgi:hypothetical protein
MGVGGQRHAPAALPPGKIRDPLYSRLGGPQGRSGGVRKISPPLGFDPRSVQPVAIRYTDCAIPALWYCNNNSNTYYYYKWVPNLLYVVLTSTYFIIFIG